MIGLVPDQLVGRDAILVESGLQHLESSDVDRV